MFGERGPGGEYVSFGRRGDAMYYRLIYSLIIVMINFSVLAGQVKIRIFAGYDPGYALFGVTAGEYEMVISGVDQVILKPGDLVLIAKFNDRLSVTLRNSESIICDSLLFTARTAIARFRVRSNKESPVRQLYSGSFQCRADLGTLVMINSCDPESYVAGVVRAEGGPGRNIEYYKTQAVIIRTYMYKYFDKHVSDDFNLCDNTHCQVFNGLAEDTVILQAVAATKGEVILGPGNSLITAAFHSNCGGETSRSEDVWITGQPYLRKVIDPFCIDSRNARWEKTIGTGEWKEYFNKAGYSGGSDQLLLNFSQRSRQKDFVAGDLSIPVRKIREDFNLRSSFFSVTTSGDSVTLKGRGYGHGVGLCQEGAMVMAEKNFDYKQIINFYYTDVVVADISEAVEM